MRQTFYFFALGLIILLASCKGPKIIAPTISNKALAEKAVADGNYAVSVENWKKHFDQQALAEVPGSDFALAALAAHKAGDPNQAVSWFDQARYKNFADADMYFTLAKIFRSQQNISKELSTLEYFKANFYTNEGEINQRLFEIYFEINMYDKLQDIWRAMDENSKSEIQNLKNWFKVNQALEKKNVCDSLALVIVEKEPENTEALVWLGDKYYWLAENRYQREMEKYNNNKTNRQYRILLGELDLATADFKRALPYFEKLWKIEPGEKYASYFANIYARFGDEAKVNFYKKYLKQP